MATLRRLYRIAGLIAWFVFMALASLPWQLARGWGSNRKISAFTMAWNKGVAKIVNLRVALSGPVPSGQGGLVISNHLGYIDIITHGSIVPSRYSAKADIAKWPLLGWYLGLSRPIWTDRESRQASRKALRDFAKTMRHGMYLIVYPEGTSTDGKNGILAFKSTPFEAAIVGNAPIYPVLTRYREVPGRGTVCWYGDMTLVPHVWEILGFNRIDAELRFLEPIYPEGRPRKDLAAYVHDIMANEYSAWVKNN
jgi:1-acyl-sn-glycerol-3-phosphate acyltransferase